MIIEKVFQLREIDQKIISDKPDFWRRVRSWLVCGILTLFFGGVVCYRFSFFHFTAFRFNPAFKAFERRLLNFIGYPISTDRCTLTVNEDFLKFFMIFNWLVRAFLILCVLFSIVGSIYLLKLLRRLNKQSSNQQHSKLVSKRKKSVILLKQILINLVIISGFFLIFCMAAIVKVHLAESEKFSKNILETILANLTFCFSAFISIIQCGVYLGTCEKLKTHTISFFLRKR